MGDIVQVLVGGLTNAAIYSLIAFSLVLVYRGSAVLNFSVGYMAVFGGLIFANHGSGGGWGGFAVSLAAGAGIGIAAYLVAVAVAEHFGADHVPIAISTLALGLVLHYFAGVIWPKQAFTTDPLWSGSFKLAGVNITYQRVFTVIVALVVLGVVVVFLEKTMIGWALEAVAHNRSTAAAYGVNVTLSLVVVWALAGIVAFAAGSLITPITAISRPISLPLAVKGFASAVVGGLGSVSGAVVGSLVVAFAEYIFIRYISTTYASAFAFLLLFVVLAVRPQGIMGQRRQVQRT